MMKMVEQQLMGLAIAHSIQVVTAESCTGGMVAERITALAGSSQWFERGFVTYSNEAKHELLGVPMTVIETHGAVSESVALAMAEGALKHSHANLSVAITGIAGPDGGSDDKPVGTVWFAWASYNNPTVTEHFLFKGDREQVRIQAADAALSGFIKLLQN